MCDSRSSLILAAKPRISILNAHVTFLHEEGNSRESELLHRYGGPEFGPPRGGEVNDSRTCGAVAGRVAHPRPFLQEGRLSPRRRGTGSAGKWQGGTGPEDALCTRAPPGSLLVDLLLAACTVRG